MEQFEKTITINYKWWIDENGATIPNSHLSELEDKAEERIAEQMADGYHGGQLLCEIGDINYNGWWTVGKEIK